MFIRAESTADSAIARSARLDSVLSKYSVASFLSQIFHGDAFMNRKLEMSPFGPPQYRAGRGS
jgi:hypothetical protein